MDNLEILQSLVRTESAGMVRIGSVGTTRVFRSRARHLHWMLEMSAELDFCTETLLLAFNYYDRMLAARHIPSRCARTLAQTCLHMAAKVNETEPLSREDICKRWAPCNAVQMKKFELLILHTLRWRLNPKTTLQVAGLLARELGFNMSSFRMKFVDKLVRLAALEPSLIHSRPSVLGAALFLSGMNAFQFVGEDQLEQVEDFLSKANIQTTAVREMERKISSLFCQGYSYPSTRETHSLTSSPISDVEPMSMSNQDSFQPPSASFKREGMNLSVENIN
mmetsp:Transcript_8744/g.18622  ORF Transcript_8744/g.18622 Transcript_8744/m.18622 type:complete len:279 (-) Transcript_8744:369-1205(-)|eukprot:CAMPEP_0185844094 /NCGR_PEP_ID=MMETSP1354-20130828/388_1 /TAXON_ID=708628 /ORGANISM="Erythrolobus madagascarensis, Strain CCMP3276" /LENGTH=278 /DNA_ID=CAMNT_0028543703 /DNA_START=365 /DNA_END=1201 /DNA_ORIENTATION=+